MNYHFFGPFVWRVIRINVFLLGASLQTKLDLILTPHVKNVFLFMKFCRSSTVNVMAQRMTYWTHFNNFSHLNLLFSLSERIIIIVFEKYIFTVIVLRVCFLFVCLLD